MKFLGEKYREATNEWYSKSGMYYYSSLLLLLSKTTTTQYYSILLTGVPWHIIVYSVPFKDAQGNWRVLNQVHVTVLEGNEPQDSATNLAITKASLLIFAKANPQIKSVLFRSDNAG